MADHEHRPQAEQHDVSTGAGAERAGASGLTDRMIGSHGATAAAIYLDREPGASPSPGSAVDAALSQAGQGESHPSGARLHTGPVAHAAARELDARAFTAGGDVYLGAAVNPATPDGQQTLRHELTHVEQSRGVAAPQPGNFRVSDPNEPAEVAARSAASGGAGGGTAEGGTLYRDPNPPGGTAPSSTSAPPASSTSAPPTSSTSAPPTSSTGGPPTASPGASPLDQFRKELAAGKGSQASFQWSKMSAADKVTAGTDQTLVNRMLEVMDTDAYIAMKEAGVNFAVDPVWAKTALDHVSDAGNMTAMKGSALWDTFVAAMPKKQDLSDAEVKSLNKFIQKDASVAKALWSNTYPDTHDGGYPGTATSKFTDPVVQRLYNKLSTSLPVQHVQTCTGGFYLSKTDTCAWWDDRSRVVLPDPDNPGYGGDKNKDHRMSGGLGTDVPQGSSSTPVAATDQDPTQTHFDASLLHEVGHGVGAHSGADVWADSGAAMPNWHKATDPLAWGALLHTPTAPAPAAAGDKVPSPTDSIKYLVGEITGHHLTTFPPDFPDANKLQAAVQKYYKDEALYKYYVKASPSPDGAYKLDNIQSNFVGDRVYLYSTRWDNSLCSYKKSAYDKRVSQYSLSSPYEWFAEQYSEYYRTQKSSPRIDADTKKKLDELDKMKFDPNKGINPHNTPGQLNAAGTSLGVFQAVQQINTVVSNVLGNTGGPGEAQGGDAAARASRRPFPFQW